MFSALAFSRTLSPTQGTALLSGWGRKTGDWKALGRKRRFFVLHGDRIDYYVSAPDSSSSSSNAPPARKGSIPLANAAVSQLGADLVIVSGCFLRK